MGHNQTGRKIGIYKELAVGILVSVAIAIAVAMGVFYICKSRESLLKWRKTVCSIRKNAIYRLWNWCVS